MKKKIIAITLIAVMAIGLCSCTAQWDRTKTDIKSNWGNGLQREINVYTADGELIAHYEGKIDIASDGDGEVKFDYKGKRYIYYNCFVETIAEK